MSLNEGISVPAVENAVDGMTWKKGSTYTNKGIEFVKDETFEQARNNAVKLVAVIADGKSSTNPKSAADAARADGVQFVAIGVGSSIKEAELKDIAGTDGTVLQVTEYA